MTVAETVTLPGQPTVGAIEYVPLGGDGFTAPHSVADFRVGLDGDASGGYGQIRVRPDARFVSLFAEVCIYADPAWGVAWDYRLDLTESGASSVAIVVTGRTSAHVGLAGLTVQESALWTPPAALLVNDDAAGTGSPYVQGFTVNPGAGFTTYLTGKVYQFDRRAREVVPLPILLGSVPRGHQVFQG